jgi:hypothetical protein
VNLRSPGASSNYHSLQANVTRRFSRNLQFGVNWTWSKAMDYVDTDTSAVSTLVSPRVWNYGLAGFDRTHVVNANWLYNIPSAYLGTNRIAQAVLGHWQFNGIAAFISGAPLGVTASTTNGADITGSPRTRWPAPTLARAPFYRRISEPRMSSSTLPFSHYPA